MHLKSLTFDAEDPTILSGTLRSTLDVFNEYEDADIVGDICNLLFIAEGEHFYQSLKPSVACI